MKLGRKVAPHVMMAAFALGFWFYGVERTMCETMGFDARASCCGVMLGVAVPLVLLTPLLLAKKLWRSEDPWSAAPALVGLAVCLTVGSIASECWILEDEAAFSTETTKTNGRACSRPRTWPNQTCALVYQPGKGIHSTD